MIAAWLLYAMVVSAVLALAAMALERALALYRQPSRYVWAGAMAGSLLVPLSVWLRSLGTPVQETSGGAQAVRLVPSVISMPANAIGQASLGTPRLGALLLVVWGMASLSILAWLAWSLWRLRRERRRWITRTLDGVPVLVSHDVGPAIVGLLSSAVVIPEWLLEANPETRRLALLHEIEHLRASDTHLLMFAVLCMALAPWNLVLWWQGRRLRDAVEVDCDGRVLRAGITPESYADLLLRLSERMLPRALPRPALAEPQSLLSRRIAEMLPRHIRARLLRAATYGAAGIALVALACDAPGPQSLSETTDPDPNAVVRVDVSEALSEDAVDRVPERISCPVPQYPRLLKEAGIEGQVLVQGVVDTAGRVFPGSVVILEASHLAFEAPSEALLSACEFRPGMKDGEPVPVIIQMPIVFRLGGESDSGQPPRILMRSPLPGDEVGLNPLYIVDGVIFIHLSMIDLDALDIESIEVIKAGAAESLYGERAKNGVVRITTKQ